MAALILKAQEGKAPPRTEPIGGWMEWLKRLPQALKAEGPYSTKGGPLAWLSEGMEAADPVGVTGLAQPMAILGVASPAAQAAFRAAGRPAIPAGSQAAQTTLEGSLRRLGAVHPDMPAMARIAPELPGVGSFELAPPTKATPNISSRRIQGEEAMGWHENVYPYRTTVVQQPTPGAEEAIGAHELTHRAAPGRGEGPARMAEAGPREAYMSNPSWGQLEDLWLTPAMKDRFQQMVNELLQQVAP